MKTNLKEEKKKFKLVPGRAWKKVCSYWQAPQCRSRKVVDARYRNVWASPLPHCQHHQFPGTPANIQYCLTTSSTFPNSLVSQDPKRIDLFSYSMGLLVRSWSPMIFHWLFCIQYQQLPFYLWCMPRGIVWVWVKSNLCRFIEGQTDTEYQEVLKWVQPPI